MTNTRKTDRFILAWYIFQNGKIGAILIQLYVFNPQSGCSLWNIDIPVQIYKQILCLFRQNKSFFVSLQPY